MIDGISEQDFKKYKQSIGEKKTALLLEAFHPDTTLERQHWIMRRFYGALLVRLKLKIRGYLKIQKNLSQEQSVLERSKAQLEAIPGETSFFMSHRIKKITEAIEILDHAQDQCQQELAHIGHHLFDLMAIYDNYANLHDKAQIINVHHSKLEQIVADKQADSFYQLVFLHRAEPENDEPFFEALFARLMDEFNNNYQLKEAMLDKFDELFPNIPKYRLVQGADGVTTLEKIPPNLKVINPDGSTRIIRRRKPINK